MRLVGLVWKYENNLYQADLHNLQYYFPLFSISLPPPFKSCSLSPLCSLNPPIQPLPLPPVNLSLASFLSLLNLPFSILPLPVSLYPLPQSSHPLRPVPLKTLPLIYTTALWVFTTLNTDNPQSLIRNLLRVWEIKST